MVPRRGTCVWQAAGVEQCCLWGSPSWQEPGRPPLGSASGGRLAVCRLLVRWLGELAAGLAAAGFAPCVESTGGLSSSLCTGKPVDKGGRIYTMRGSCTNFLCQIFLISTSLETSLVSVKKLLTIIRSMF